jgi:hypothetical protein
VALFSTPISSFLAHYCTPINKIEITAEMRKVGYKDGTIHLFMDDRNSPWATDPGRKLTKIVKPSPADWEKLFRICEEANLWGLGEQEEQLTQGSIRLAIVPYPYWKFNLEYRDRHLNIQGSQVTMLSRLKIDGHPIGGSQILIISKNLMIARQYKPIQKIFNFLNELLSLPYSFDLLDTTY